VAEAELAYRDRSVKRVKLCSRVMMVFVSWWCDILEGFLESFIMLLAQVLSAIPE
jgi:hypothetical protein